uniref:Uncharacterized protein n=1 Tax=Arundo donax TaxID=35708 RepID=A0A0A9EWW2_ARUDO
MIGYHLSLLRMWLNYESLRSR